MTIATLYLFIYLFKQITLWEQKLRNHQSYKLEIWTDDRSIHELRHCHFGGATSRGLGHSHPKFVTAKFIK